MKKIFLITFLCISFFPTCSSLALWDEKSQQKKIEKSAPYKKISLNSGYLYSSNSNRAIGDFMVEINDLYGFAYEKIEKMLGLKPGIQTFIYDVVLNAGYIIGVFDYSSPKFLLSDQINTTFHEFGHFSRAVSLAVLAEFNGGYTSFFPYFFNYFTTIFSNDSNARSYVRFGEISDLSQSFLLSSGGFNNQTYFSELVVENAYLNDSHPMTFFSYLSAKSSVVNYIYATSGKDLNELDVFDAEKIEKIGNDIRDMVQQYRLLGKNIKTQDIKFASNMAILLSGSIYAYLWSIYQFQFDRSFKMKPFEFYGVRIPDTSVYFNPSGISYKISSGYKYNQEWVFPVSFEFITKGDTAYEMTLGVYKKFPQMNNSSLHADFLISHQGEMAGKIYGEFPIGNSYYIGIGAQHYNTNTLYGARNIPWQTSGSNSYNEFWIQIGLRY